MIAAQRMEPVGMTLAALLDGIAPTGAAGDLVITDLTLDSRCVTPGALFLACAGVRSHGALYVADALRRGAAAVLVDAAGGEEALALADGQGVPALALPDLTRLAGPIAERFFGAPSAALTLIGVTGTNGKTSVALFIAKALADDAPCGVIGTLGSGLVGQLQATGHTTPDAVTVHRQLAWMLGQGARSTVMEVSSHGLMQGRVEGIAFDVAVFTNLTHEHLDYHGDMDRYAAAKRRLLDRPGLRRAVINRDDPVGRAWLAALPAGVTAIDYGFTRDDTTPRLFGHDLRLDADGLAFAVASPWGNATLRTGLLGRFNASNLLAALGALLATGMEFDTAVARLSHAATVPGRMERFGGREGPQVVVDYAHTPDALAKVLIALNEHCEGRLWCVFGCGGDRDPSKRPLMGQIAETYADSVVLTDDNPRSEDPYAIIEAIQRGMRNPDASYVVRDRVEAIALALQMAHEDDIVLVAGKGHETEQEIAGQKLPFSDREQVTRLLAEVRHG